MLEKVLLRAFFMLHASDFEGDDDRHPYQFGKSRSARRRAFTLLSSVCWQWHQTLTFWPESPAGHWLKKLVKREFTVHTLLLSHPGHMYQGRSNFQTFFRLTQMVVAYLVNFIVQVQIPVLLLQVSCILRGAW